MGVKELTFRSENRWPLGPRDIADDGKYQEGGSLQIFSRSRVINLCHFHKMTSL